MKKINQKNNAVILILDLIEFELLEDIIKAALLNDDISNIYKSNFRNVWKMIHTQEKSATDILLINETDKKILKSILQEKITRIQQTNVENNLNITPLIQELFENSKKNMLNLINQL